MKEELRSSKKKNNNYFQGGNMNSQAIIAFLQSLLPLAEPELLQLWEGSLKPWVASKIAMLGSQEEQSLCNIELAAIDAMVVAELPKI
jgi:hypothetical protein